MDLYLDRALILFPLLPPVPIHSSLAIHMELLARLVIEHWEDRTAPIAKWPVRDQGHTSWCVDRELWEVQDSGRATCAD